MVEAVDGPIHGHVAKVITVDRVERWTDPEGWSFDAVQEGYLTTRRIEGVVSPPSRGYGRH